MDEETEIEGWNNDLFWVKIDQMVAYMQPLDLKRHLFATKRRMKLTAHNFDYIILLG